MSILDTKYQTSWSPEARDLRTPEFYNGGKTYNHNTCPGFFTPFTQEIEDDMGFQRALVSLVVNPLRELNFAMNSAAHGMVEAQLSLVSLLNLELSDSVEGIKRSASHLGNFVVHSVYFPLAFLTEVVALITRSFAMLYTSVTALLNIPPAEGIDSTTTSENAMTEGQKMRTLTTLIEELEKAISKRNDNRSEGSDNESVDVSFNDDDGDTDQANWSLSG